MSERNPGPITQNSRIPIRNPDKDPGFLNQVPILDVHAVEA